MHLGKLLSTKPGKVFHIPFFEDTNKASYSKSRTPKKKSQG